VTRRQTIIGVSVFALLCLAIGIVWTLRTEPPSAHPWWAGKEAKVKIEVWEPGKDMPTVAMTLPKRTIDTMIALGMRSRIEVGHQSLDFRKYWRQIQSQPPGAKTQIQEEEATILVWIETPDSKQTSGIPPDSIPDSTATSAF
jgi:hypothetical protein